MRRVGNSFFLPSSTDRSEAEHRVDFLGGALYCTCIGFVQHSHCKHCDEVKELLMESVEERALIVRDSADLPDVWRNPNDLRRRLEDMREERSLVHDFMRDVMVPSRDGEADGDYGIVPGTDKPTLFKPGAEKLCELYGYAPVIVDMPEYADEETGHYRVVIRLALIHKGSGVKVAEGVGQCSTREKKYWKRWAFESDVPAGLDKKRLKTQTRKSKKTGNPYTVYEIENDDLHSLWNTILKMAKKRALVDATLSATRSSGIFTQSAEHLDEWIDAEFEDVTEKPECDHGPDKGVRILSAAEFDKLPKNTEYGWICMTCGTLLTAATVPPASDPSRAQPDEKGTGLRRGSSRGATQPAPAPRVEGGVANNSESSAPAATPPEALDELTELWQRFNLAAADVKRDIINELVLHHSWTKVGDYIEPHKANSTPEQREALLAYLRSCPI